MNGMPRSKYCILYRCCNVHKLVYRLNFIIIIITYADWMAAILIPVSLLVVVCGGVVASSSQPPQPPAWPEQFTATLFVKNGSSLSELELAYDWPGGRNLIRIAKQQGNVLWDMEWNNGTSFYFDLEVS